MSPILKANHPPITENVDNKIYFTIIHVNSEDMITREGKMKTWDKNIIWFN